MRRDVHMRAASLVRNLQEKTGSNWVLVLPPWPWLYHWKSSERVPYQPWSKFFDLPSLNEFVPSIEFNDYLEINGHLINEVGRGLKISPSDDVTFHHAYFIAMAMSHMFHRPGDGFAEFQR